MDFQFHSKPKDQNESEIVASYKILKIIQESSKYTLYSGKRLSDNKSVLIKSVPKSTIVDDSTQLQFQREVDSLHYLQSPHIIQFLDFFSDNFHYYMVFEKLTSLQDYIYNNRKLKEIEASSIFTGILQGVKICHNNGIALRSLSLSNIYITKKKGGKRFIAKLSGFEYCSFFSLQSPNIDEADITCFTAPEQFSKNLPRIDSKSDIWSLGVILYMMLTGCQPWDSSNPVILKSNILKANFEVPYWVSEPCREIIEGMLKVKPLHRLSIEDALQSTFVKCSCENPTLQRVQQRQMEELSIRSNYMFINSPLTAEKSLDTKSASEFSSISSSQSNNFQEINDRPLPQRQYDNDGAPLEIVRIIQSPFISPVPISYNLISSKRDSTNRSFLAVSAQSYLKGMRSSSDASPMANKASIFTPNKRTGSTINEPMRQIAGARSRPNLPNISNRHKISRSTDLLAQKPFY